MPPPPAPPAAPTLRLFRSLWGLAVHPKPAASSSSSTSSPSSASLPPPSRGTKAFPSRQALLRHVARAGGRRKEGKEGGREGGLYRGIEASLFDLGSTKEERRDMVRAFSEEQGLDLIVGIYSSWQDYECRNDHYKPPSLHLAQFQSQLEEAMSLGPLHVNAHTGCDAWSEEKEVLPFFEKVLEAQRAMGSEISISHETHRGRPLSNPFLTLRLLHALPSLRLTADISHWMVVCERLLGGREGGREGGGVEEELLRAVARRTDHVHARVGNAQSAQVLIRREGGGKEEDEIEGGMEERELFERFWEWVQEAGREGGREGWTVTPEYGPGYGGGGEMDVDKVNEEMARWFRTRFGTT